MGLFTLILILSILGYSGLMVLCIRGFDEINEIQTPNYFSADKSVSIIVPVRNEEAYVNECVKSLINQSYEGDYEIIFINDHSTDDTLSILKKWEPTIKIIDWQDHTTVKAFKKQAITMAIQEAKGELIITTDGDTIREKNWLSAMVHYYQLKRAKLLVGPVIYRKDHTPLNIFQRIDFLVMQVITAAGLRFNFYKSCNGANLAFARSLFLELNGYEGNNQYASGDDVFFLHKVEDKYPNGAHYIKNKDAIVTTHAAPSLSAFLSQRIRWAGKAVAYKDNLSKLVLAITSLTNIGLILHLLFSILGWKSWLSFGIFFVIKTGIESILLWKGLQFFEQKLLLIPHILLQPLHWLYIAFCTFVAPFAKTSWKGRTIDKASQ